MEKLSDFVYNTPFEQGVHLAQRAKLASKTILIFHRYLGCSNCQLILWNILQAQDDFARKDAQPIVVVQSKPEIVKQYYKKISCFLMLSVIRR